MSKYTVSQLRSAPVHHPRASKPWRRALAASTLSLTLASSACLSDVEVSECAKQGNCPKAGAAGMSDAGASANAGQAGALGESGEAGDDGSRAGNAGQGGNGGDGQWTGGGPSAGAGGNVAGGGTWAGDAGQSGTGGAARNEGGVILPEVLPRSCANHSYSAALTISNGTPPYRWQVASTDWKIAVDPTFTNRATLSAEHVPPGTTSLVLDVTDSNSVHTMKSLSIVAREACWFAYTALESSGPTLKLLDPLSTPPSALPLEHNQGVYDFQFSPSGQFLAYRFGRDASHPKGRHLALITLSTLHEQLIDVLEDSLVAYGWSPDSKLLALAFIKDGATFLTAVRIPAPDSNTAPVELAPKPAFVESELYWVGNSFVAFHAQRLPDLAHPGQWLPDNPYLLRTPFFARLDETGFDAPQAIVQQPYGPSVYLRATPQGFFMIGDNTYFNPLAPTLASPVPLWTTNVISPSGQYAAELADDGQVLIFSGQKTLDGNPLTTSQNGQQCPMLLTWARDRERFACVADTNDPASLARGEVRVFDLSAAGDHLTMTPVQGVCATTPEACAGLTDQYVYSEQRASEQARAFSPSGRWLAFASASSSTDNFLYWADLNETPYRLKGKAYYFSAATTAHSPTEISFSPDEDYVLLRRGNQLLHWRLANQANFQLLTNQMELGAKCNDDFMSGPDQWCGNTDRSAMFHWAADTTALSYRTASEVTVFELSNRYSYRLPAPACQGQCDGQFAFQPSLTP